MRKLNFISLAFKAEQKCGSGTSHLWKSRQILNAEVDLPIFAELKLQSGSAEAELHIVGSQGRAEMR